MKALTAEELYWLWLHSNTGISARKFYKVLLPFESAGEVYELAQKKDHAVFAHVDEKTRELLFKTANSRYIGQYRDWLYKRQIDVATLNSENYPKLLRNISDPPPVLFIKGHLDPEPDLPIAIVGARHCTDYGKTVAEHFAYGLACAGASVISGMAYGVDRHASIGALKCEDTAASTVAVLGCGVDVVYPKTNEALYHQLAERGAVISEFRPQTRPSKVNFPIRNRIISGLSKGVLVIEAGERSGTSITVGQALEQGRDVFAVPGRITDFKSLGTNLLIQQGKAKLVWRLSDILEEYAYEYEPAQDRTVIGNIHDILPPNASEIEKQICESLLQGEKSFDELCEHLSYSPAEINSSLTQMCFLGIMKQLPGRVYALHYEPKL